MSQENVEIVRRDIAARNARDWAVLAEIWHPDIEIEIVEGLETLRGLDEIRPWFDGLSDLYAEYRVEEEELIDAGDRVVTVERLAGRGLKGSDATAWIEEALFRIVTFKEGRIWRVKEYPSRGQALEAAGMRE
jgi:ketosteroid isomerase-like protein